MTEDKTYFPEVIQENPFPSQDSVIPTQVSSESGGTYSPTTTNDKPIVKKRIATELLSTALNTRSKRILQEFELTQSGGFKIGNYKEGVTGEVAITPNGVEAKDVAGLTTFALDGTTGDAIFKGTLQAGSTIVASTIVTEQSSSGNGRTVYYNNGIPSIIIGDPS